MTRIFRRCLFLPLLLIASPALADLQVETAGDACGTAARAAFWEQSSICNTASGQWQRPAFQLGSAITACDAASKAGLLQWTGTGLQLCGGASGWATLAGPNGVNALLGSSVTGVNPQRSGDATTGLVSLVASTVGIVTAGVERLRVTATGSVGIGTTGPIATLEVRGTTGGYSFLAGDGTNSFYAGALAGGAYFGNRNAGDLITLMNGVEKMRVTTAGNVGIGTTSPTNKLHVEGTEGGSAGIYLNSAVPSATSYTLYNDAGTLKWNGAEIGASASVTLGTATGSTNPQRSGDATTGLVSLAASTVGIVTAGVEALRVTATGSVGIGTTGPAYKLDVAGTARVTGGITGDSGITIAGYPDFNYGEIEIQGTQSTKAPFVRFHRPMEEYGQIRYGTDATNDNRFYMRNINANSLAKVSVATPTDANDAATKAYVDAAGAGTWKTQTYSTPGTYTWTLPTPTPSEIQVFLVGGGGGGGGGCGYNYYRGGGGGGGAILRERNLPVTGDLTVIVGAGGSGTYCVAGNGGYSRITGAGVFTITADGGRGGTGAFSTSDGDGGAGGSIGPYAGGGGGKTGGGGNGTCGYDVCSGGGGSEGYSGGGGNVSYAYQFPVGTGGGGGGGGGASYGNGGSSGTAGGVGAGGGGSSTNGGAGGAGMVIIYYKN